MNAPVKPTPAPWQGRDDPRPRCYSNVDSDYTVVSVEWIDLPWPCKVPLRELERAYFAWVPKISMGAVRPRWEGDDGPLRLSLQPGGWLDAIRLSPAEVSETRLERRVQGGLLAHEGGSLSFSVLPRGEGIEVTVALVGFRPRMPRWLYLPTQRRLHVRSTYAFLREISRRVRPQPMQRQHSEALPRFRSQGPVSSG